MNRASEKVILGACEEIDEAVGELRGLIPGDELDEINKATHGIRRALCETLVPPDSLPPPSPYAFYTPKPGEFS